MIFRDICQWLRYCSTDIKKMNDRMQISFVENAEYLYGLGIVPELRTGSDKEQKHCCSIGFCDKEQKWYGWSHRAMYGFGVGSVTTEGDCSYQPPNKEAFGRNMMNFFCDDEWMTEAAFTDSVDTEGVRGILITATYNDAVPNEKMRGTEYSNFWPYPKKFGRGEWVAETMDDAKQMAEDFAEGVS